MENLLTLSHIAKSYGKKTVLTDVDGQFIYGQIVAIVGVNGCGKSTLFKIILKLANANKGEVCYDDLSNGIIETPQFYSSFTGRENLNVFLGIGKYDEGKLKRMATEFNILEDLDSPVKKYSLGMKQKLAIILVLLSNAKVLLFDEPTNALDQSALMTFKQFLKIEKESGKLIFVSSHDYSYVTALVDKIYELKDGKLSPMDLTNEKESSAHLLEFENINEGINIAKSLKCNYKVVDNKYLIIYEWYLPFERLIATFLSCGIKTYCLLNSKEKIEEQLRSKFYEN